jgi:hypothetical protein
VRYPHLQDSIIIAEIMLRAAKRQRGQQPFNRKPGNRASCIRGRLHAQALEHDGVELNRRRKPTHRARLAGKAGLRSNPGEGNPRLIYISNLRKAALFPRRRGEGQMRPTAPDSARGWAQCAAIHLRYWADRRFTSIRSMMKASNGDMLGFVIRPRLMARIWYLMLAM